MSSGRDSDRAGSRPNDGAGENLASSPTVLVIDDCDDTLALVSLEMEDFGYRVQATASGRRGIDLAISERPDVVLLDLMMSPLSGYDVLNLLAKSPSTDSIPVIVISSLDYCDAAQYAELSRPDFIQKPIDFDHLNDRVRTLTASG